MTQPNIWTWAVPDDPEYRIPPMATAFIDSNGSSPDSRCGHHGTPLELTLVAPAEHEYRCRSCFPEMFFRRASEIRPPHPSHGVRLISAERERQILQEGFTNESDAAYVVAELSLAALSYAEVGAEQIRQPALRGGKRLPASEVSSRTDFPWTEDWWKPSDNPIINLVKAGALIAAEIDRLYRKALDY